MFKKRINCWPNASGLFILYFTIVGLLGSFAATAVAQDGKTART